MVAYCAGYHKQYNQEPYRDKRMRAQLTRSEWALKAGQDNLTDNQRVWTVTHPFYALEHDEHNFFDFENLDIPYYVHCLGRPHLLNSRGNKVDVGQAVTWQNGQWHDIPAIAGNTGRGVGPAALSEYFSASATAFVRQQLDILLQTHDPEFFQRVTGILEEILKLESVETSVRLDRIPDPEKTIPGDTPDNAEIPAGEFNLSGRFVLPSDNKATVFRRANYVYVYNPKPGHDDHKWKVYNASPDGARVGDPVYTRD
jgi:hypothetical protein